MDADLSTDGVDEVLRIMYGGVPSWGRFTPDPKMTVRVRTTDTGLSWLLTLGRFTGTDDDGPRRARPQGRRVRHRRGGSRHSAWGCRGPRLLALASAARGSDRASWDPVVLEHLDQTIAAGIS